MGYPLGSHRWPEAALEMRITPACAPIHPARPAIRAGLPKAIAMVRKSRRRFLQGLADLQPHRMSMIMSRDERTLPMPDLCWVWFEADGTMTQGSGEANFAINQKAQVGRSLKACQSFSGAS